MDKIIRSLKIFFTKFVGFYKAENGEMWKYNDHLGFGTFRDERHILWITIIIFLTIILYKFCKKNKNQGKKTIKILMVTMLITRIVIQIVNTIMGSSLPKGRDLIPGQMCTILIYLLPLTIIFNWKKIKTPVFVLSMMGGIMTFLINDYFESGFLSFYTLEGMWAHTMLFVIPIAMMGLEEFKLEKNKIWQIIVTMLLMIMWAIFLNKILFKNYNPNYFYLERNMLPGNIGEKYFFFVYTLIFFILLALIYAIPLIYSKLDKWLIGDNIKLKRKINTIIIASIILISMIGMIYVKQKQKPKLNTEKDQINLALATTMMSEYSLDYTTEQIQKRLNRIVGENKVKVYDTLFGIKVKFIETGNKYNINDSIVNVKANKIRNVVSEIIIHDLEVILIMNLALSVGMICKSKIKTSEKA